LPAAHYLPRRGKLQNRNRFKQKARFPEPTRFAWVEPIAMEENMTEVTAWTAPEACEICVGMEVTSYMSAEL
jgi:coenzyme PQQ precursor peptide PqqA